jgi:rhodanese-related sulfurtransferase
MGVSQSSVNNEAFIDRFRKLEPISTLSDEQIRELVSQSAIDKISEGSSLLGDAPDDEAIYLLSGAVEATLHSGEPRLIRGGAQDALYPLNSDHNNFRMALTRTPAVIARVDKALLDVMLTWAQITAPETDVLMSEDGIISINKADWLNTMFKSPTFRNLPAANIEELLYRLEPVRVHAGDVIIRQGEQGDYFYMIDKGVAMVTINPEDDEGSVIMAELNEGATFGEAALISDIPRNATVAMMDDGILLRLSKDDFNKLLKQPTLHQTSFADASRKVEQGQACWVDVRLPSEYERSHLPGAINIPMRDMHRMAQDLDKDKTYICYCETGNRSSAATFVLKQYDLTATVLTDGLNKVPKASLSQ